MKIKLTPTSLRNWIKTSIATLFILVCAVVATWAVRPDLLFLIVNVSISVFITMSVVWWIWFLIALRRMIACWFKTEESVNIVISEIRYLRKILAEETAENDK